MDGAGKAFLYFCSKVWPQRQRISKRADKHPNVFTPFVLPPLPSSWTHNETPIDSKDEKAEDNEPAVDPMPESNAVDSVAASESELPPPVNENSENMAENDNPDKSLPKSESENKEAVESVSTASPEDDKQSVVEPSQKGESFVIPKLSSSKSERYFNLLKESAKRETQVSPLVPPPPPPPAWGLIPISVTKPDNTKKGPASKQPSGATKQGLKQKTVTKQGAKQKARAVLTNQKKPAVSSDAAKTTVANKKVARSRVDSSGDEKTAEVVPKPKKSKLEEMPSDSDNVEKTSDLEIAAKEKSAELDSSVEDNTKIETAPQKMEVSGEVSEHDTVSDNSPQKQKMVPRDARSKSQSATTATRDTRLKTVKANPQSGLDTSSEQVEVGKAQTSPKTTTRSATKEESTPKPNIKPKTVAGNSLKVSPQPKTPVSKELKKKPQAAAKVSSPTTRLKAKSGTVLSKSVPSQNLKKRRSLGSSVQEKINSSKSNEPRVVEKEPKSNIADTAETGVPDDTLYNPEHPLSSSSDDEDKNKSMTCPSTDNLQGPVKESEKTNSVDEASTLPSSAEDISVTNSSEDFPANQDAEKSSQNNSSSVSCAPQDDSSTKESKKSNPVTGEEDDLATVSTEQIKPAADDIENFSISTDTEKGTSEKKPSEKPFLVPDGKKEAAEKPKKVSRMKACPASHKKLYGIAYDEKVGVKNETQSSGDSVTSDEQCAAGDSVVEGSKSASPVVVMNSLKPAEADPTSSPKSKDDSANSEILLDSGSPVPEKESSNVLSDAPDTPPSGSSVETIAKRKVQPVRKTRAVQR